MKSTSDDTFSDTVPAERSVSAWLTETTLDGQPASSPQWDSFVLASGDAHAEQLAGWGELQRERGWAPARVTLRHEGEVVGGVQLLHRRVKWLGRVGYIRRGPLGSWGIPGLEQRLSRAAYELGRDCRLSYLGLVLPYSGGHLQKALAEEGFIVKPPFWPPSSPESASISVDLEPPLDDILAGMRTTTRRYIRQGQRKGLAVRQGTEEDLETFSRLMLALCHRRGARPNVPTGQFLHRMWAAFAPGGHLKLFVAEAQNQPVAALLVLATGTWARAWRIGWSGEHADLRPNETIYWEAMKWAKANGYRHFDFMGMNREAAIACLNHQPPPQNAMALLTQFKCGFGGKPLALEPWYCAFFNPIVSRFLAVGGERLLYWRVFQHLSKRLTSRFSSAQE